MNVPLLRDVKESARLLGVSPSTVRRLIADSDLVPVRVRGRVMVSNDELEAYVRKLQEQSKQPTKTAQPLKLFASLRS